MFYLFIIIIVVITILICGYVDAQEANSKALELHSMKINFPEDIGRSIFNYQKRFGNIYEYYTSYSVVMNSKNYPFKYVCKYFELPVGNDLKQMLEQKMISNQQINEMNDLRKKIINDTEGFIESQSKYTYDPHVLINERFDLKEKVVFNREIVEDDLADIFRFRDSNGYSRTDIVLNNKTISNFIEYIEKQTSGNDNKKNERGRMTPQLRAQVLARDDYTCQKCGASIYNEPNLLLEVDHIIPVSKGGKTIIDNLQTLCWKCNRSKGSG